MSNRFTFTSPKLVWISTWLVVKLASSKTPVRSTVVGAAVGDAVVGLDGFTRHNSLFPYSGGVLALLADELADYGQTKGSLHFALDRPLPTTLLKRILRVRIDEINASYPKKNGTFRKYARNGSLTIDERR